MENTLQYSYFIFPVAFNNQKYPNKFAQMPVRAVFSLLQGANDAPPFGESSSFFLETENESIYFTGDANFDVRLKTGLSATRPKLIIANSGEYQFKKKIRY